jgi:hypothetical protein
MYIPEILTLTRMTPSGLYIQCCQNSVRYTCSHLHVFGRSCVIVASDRRALDFE